MSERYLVQVAISKSTHDKLLRAQALLSHAVPSGNVAQVIDRALDALITQLEKRKFGSAQVPSQPPRSVPKAARRTRSTSRARHIPARIRRAVWERDQGRCTFVGSNGTRCGTRKFLEYDHIEPVARGGVASVAGVRLRCRAHNQYEAERTFGAGFMSLKREEARRDRPSAIS
jgi:5-methylcytosine-specific restriction endonuclease McrA